MSIYGSDSLNAATNDVNMDEIVEAFIYDDISRGTDEQIKEFCNSETAKILVEAGKLRKPTMVRLGKEDDFKRRVKITALNLAKQAKDPTFKKLSANRKKEKQYISQIMKKYGKKAEKVAREAQRDYIKAGSGASAKPEKK